MIQGEKNMDETRSRQERMEIIGDPKKFNEELLKIKKKIEAELGWCVTTI